MLNLEVENIQALYTSYYCQDQMFLVIYMYYKISSLLWYIKFASAVFLNIVQSQLPHYYKLTIHVHVWQQSFNFEYIAVYGRVFDKKSFLFLEIYHFLWLAKRSWRISGGVSTVSSLVSQISSIGSSLGIPLSYALFIWLLFPVGLTPP